MKRDSDENGEKRDWWNERMMKRGSDENVGDEKRERGREKGRERVWVCEGIKVRVRECVCVWETEIASGRNGTRLRNIIEDSTKKISSAYKTSKWDREVMYVDNKSKLKIKSKKKKKEKRKKKKVIKNQRKLVL